MFALVAAPENHLSACQFEECGSPQLSTFSSCNVASERSERAATAASAVSGASSLGRSEDIAQLLDIVRWLSFVEHRVAVGANRHQVLDRV